MNIHFHFLAPVSLKARRSLKAFIASIFKTEKAEAFSIDYIFCSDEYILGINRDFLQHDYFTDIITFDLSPERNMPVVGEIYISIDTIRSNAETYNSGFQEELHRVIFHGILHLCGYKDKTKSQKLLMREKEDYYLRHYFDSPG